MSVGRARNPHGIDPAVEPEKYEFIQKLMELRKSMPKEFRARALYLTHNPRAPRDRHGRKMHARSRARVRPIDYARAKAVSESWKRRAA